MKNKWHKLMLSILADVTTKNFVIQTNFDTWHKRKTIQLQTCAKHKLTIGQAQKWINMALKYSFVLGENRIGGITQNYRFFHVPIDNIIQNELEHHYKIARIPISWSTVNDYNIYMDYQNAVRDKVTPAIPLDVEFKLFNRKLP